MSGKPCDQRGLIEALHDGRLGPAERGTCERHLRNCASCAAYAEELVGLRRALQSADAQPTPLEHQRARLSLLRAAATPTRRAVAPRRSLVLVAMMLATTALAGVAGWQAVRVARTVAPATPLIATPVQQSLPEAPVVQSSQRDPVPQAAARTPAEAEAPDRDPVEPSASQEPPAAATRLSRHAVHFPAHRNSPPPADHDLAPDPAPLAIAPEPPPVPPPPPPPQMSPASRDFAAAVDALGNSDFGLAAARFRGFAASYPQDPRADEAAYLIAIALDRAGRMTEARSAAERYLAERPHGVHRGQARKLLGIPSAPEAPVESR